MTESIASNDVAAGKFLAADIAARRDRALQRSVMICTPIARNPTWQYTASLASTLLFLREQNIRCTFQFTVGGSIVSKTRNELVAHFLKSDYTDCLFIDDDMEWYPNSVLRLLGSDKSIIGGAGRMRAQKPNTDPEVWCWRPLTDADGNIHQDDMGAIEVCGFGAAFMLINRGVFFALAKAHPEWKRPGPEDWPSDVRENYFEFFTQNDNNSGFEISEDYVFCNRARANGETCWVDPSITLGHVGAFNYRGSVAEILKRSNR